MTVRPIAITVPKEALIPVKARFLRTSHPTMPNLILSDTDRGDLIAYILSLR
jgi:hypothetical protein